VRTSILSRAGWVAAATLLAATAVPVTAGAATASTAAAPGRILFSTDSGGRSAASEIWTMAPDGTDPVRLTTNSVYDGEPVWSPDGTRIAFTSTRAGTLDTWVMNADGTGAARLTVHNAADISPTWSPDGHSIAFASNRSGYGDIYTMNADGSGPRILYGSTAVEDAPSWSPDGQWVAFTRATQIVKVRHDGVQLTALTSAAQAPAWSPDGDQIAFSSNRDGNAELYVMAADGTAQTRLTTTPEAERFPSWTPDGQHLLHDRVTATISQLARTAADGASTSLLTSGSTHSSDADAAPAASTTAPSQPGTATGSTSTGQSMTVSVTSPLHEARLPATTDPLPVSGTVELDATSGRPYHAAYVVDVSGSTTQVRHQDCDGSGSVTTADNFNNDGIVGDILDCEIAGVIALNTAVQAVPGATAGVIALGGNSATPSAMADMSPAPGDQPFAAATAHENGTTRGDVEFVLRSMIASRVQHFTTKNVGTGTHYDASLHKVNEHFRFFEPGGTNVAYFLSDGEPNSGTFNTTTAGPLHTAVLRGTRIFTYAVGLLGGCNPGKALRIIADQTGGTCTPVTNPALIAAAVGTPATLSEVNVQLGNGNSVPATLDTTTTPASWHASLPGLPAGTHTLKATAMASDGSSVTASLTVTGIAPPVVEAGGPYAVPEGSSLPLAGTATDADSPSFDLAWTPANRLTGATTLTPTYAGDDDREEVLTLTATDSDGLTDSATTTVTTLNVAPTLGALTLTPRPITGSETVLQVPFTDPGALDTHTATVDWGDGTVEDATVDSGEVSAAHTYASGGSYTISLTLADDDGGTATLQHGPFRVNTTPEVHAGGPYVVDEGTPLQLAGSASDADGDPLTLTWSPGARLSDPSSPTSSYDTSDDSATDLTLTADDGDLSASSQTSVTVLNVAPTVTSVTGPAGVVAPGTPLTVGVAWTDAGALDTHMVHVDWGDGTSDTVGVNGGGSASLPHTYAAGGVWTVTVTVSDDDGGFGTGTTTVYTNRPPVVDAGPDLVVDEGTLTQLAATATDPDGDLLTLSWTPADAVSAADVEDPFFEALDDGAQTLTLTAIDRHGASASDTVEVVVRNVDPVLSSLTGPDGPRAIGTTVTLTGDYTDAGSLDTHTVEVAWGDGSTSAGTASGGTLTADHVYAAPGVYTVIATLTDDDGGSTSRAYEYVVIYDPEGGFVTGGGSFDSPAGAYPADPTATGRATFGFTARYQKGKSVPDGQTQFQFKAGGLSFHSAAYEWLVVSGTRATYRGTGEVNGVGGYAFQLAAVDGQRPGGDKVDRIRMKVWDPATGVLVYDNQVGSTDDAAPTTALTGGSIVIHG
jgi:PKD repeat protein